MKFSHPFVLTLFTCAALVPLAATRQSAAQTLSNSSTVANLDAWDPAAVISVSGSIGSIVLQHVAGTPGGSNILVSSIQGDLYANFGSRLNAQLAQQLTGGQFVTLTGLLRTYNGNKYLLVRTLNFNGRTFLIRNAYGVPMKSMPTTTQSARLRQGSFGGAR